jgi:hypothetical protein
VICCAGSTNPVAKEARWRRASSSASPRCSGCPSVSTACSSPAHATARLLGVGLDGELTAWTMQALALELGTVALGSWLLRHA